MIVNEFSYLSCLSPTKLSLEGGLQRGVSDSWEVSEVASFIISKDKRFSFRCSAKHQTFQIWLRKFKARLTFPFVFKCKPLLPRCLLVIFDTFYH